jgi:hypothetical protein
MKGFGVTAALIGLGAGIIWPVTFSYAQGCTITGQLEGRLCYPTLTNIHSVAEPVALIGLIGA